MKHTAFFNVCVNWLFKLLTDTNTDDDRGAIQEEVESINFRS